ncbi:MAG: universal stress protein [Acidimicrobiales bacterium]
MLVPVKSLEESIDALDVAARFARTSGGRLRLVHVRTWDPPLPGTCRFYAGTSEEATAALDAAMAHAWGSGVEASGIVVEARASQIGTAVVVEAMQWSADIVVVHRRPRGLLPRGAWDKATGNVLRLSPCPVLVVRPGSAMTAAVWASPAAN